MYESYYHLTERPFQAAVLPGRYFPAHLIETARQTLARSIERAEGIGLLMGPSGTGKSLLAQVLADQFRSQFSVALLANGSLPSRRAMLQAILFELRLPYHGLDEGELRLSLIDFLSSNDRSPNGMLLIIDEAHELGLRLLEEVRMITNLVRHGSPRVRLVLVGSMTLEERFASPRLEAFAQRVRSRCYLGSLDAAETAGYVKAQIASLGGPAETLFTAEALEKLHAATDGIPRLINQVCDHALVLGYSGGVATIDGVGIEEAWSDLQQLPMPPHHGVPQLMTDEVIDDVIEYGSLEDDAATSTAAPTPAAASLLVPLAATTDARADEFQPMSSLQPEVELVFSGAPDPFAERFDEEEVIMDRYAGADSGLRNARPVYSAEGLQLSALLEPFLRATPEAIEFAEELTEDEPTAIVPGESALRAYTAPVESYEHDEPAELDPADDPVMPEDSWEPKAAPARETTAAVRPVPTRAPEQTRATEQARAPAPTPMPSPSTHSIDELEMIIVEDDPAPPTSEAIRGPIARRQEYRQLFVKLRGS